MLTAYSEIGVSQCFLRLIVPLLVLTGITSNVTHDSRQKGFMMLHVCGVMFLLACWLAGMHAGCFQLAVIEDNKAS